MFDSGGLSGDYDFSLSMRVLRFLRVPFFPTPLICFERAMLDFFLPPFRFVEDFLGDIYFSFRSSDDCFIEP